MFRFLLLVDAAKVVLLGAGLALVIALLAAGPRQIQRMLLAAVVAVDCVV